MKKVLGTLAAGAILATGLTQAKAADLINDNGTKLSVYGVAHISVDSINNGKNTDLKVASNSSRLGVKASKEIADGITALAQFEVGVDLTGTGKDDGNGGDYNNNAALFTSARDSFIGISGPFGMILAGNLPAQNQYLYDYNLFADQVGDLGNLWGASNGVPDRASDTIAYFIPNVVPGLSGDIAYVSDLSGNNNGKKITGQLVKLNYKISGLKLGLCYVSVTDDAKVLLKDNNNNPYKSKITNYAITASYSFEGFSVGGGYLQTKSDNKDAGTSNKKTSFTVGASYSVSGAKFKVQYTSLKDDAKSANANQIAVGVDYSLAKNVTVYAAYAKTTNDKNASYLANDWGHGKSKYGTPANAGDDPSAISVGLSYSF